MTIAENIRKILCLAMTFALLLSCLCSCASENDEFSDLDTLHSSIGVEIDTYHIVMPSACSAPLVQSVKTLAEKIESALTVECKVDYDTQGALKGDDVMQIYIGNADKKLEKHTDNMRAEDYIYRAYDTFFILGGYSDSASIAAIDRFLIDVLPNCESKNIFEYEGDFSHTAEYKISEFLLCGYDLSEFDFCISPSRESAEGKIAEALYDKIVDMCGACSQISFSSSPEDSCHEVVFRKADGEGANIYYDGEDMIFEAHDAYGFSIAAEKFYSFVCEAMSEGKVALDISEKLSYSYSEPTVNISVAMPKGKNISESIAFADKISKQGADIILLGLVDSEQLQLIENQAVGYTFSSEAVDGGTALAVAYKNTISSCVPQFDAEGGVVLLNVTLRSSGELFSVIALCERSAENREANIKLFEKTLVDAQNAAVGIYMSADNAAIDAGGDGFEKADEFVLSDGPKRTVIYSENGQIACSASLAEDDTVNISASKLYCDEYLENIGK